MEVFVLLKGYDFEGFGSNVEVFSTREAAEARKQEYIEDHIQDENDNYVSYGYDYSLLTIVKRTIK